MISQCGFLPWSRSMCLWAFSIMMMTASTIAPMAMAMPPSDMMLELMPWPNITSNAISTATGKIMIATSALRRCSRNRKQTSATTMLSSENIALNEDVRSAHEALMGSPAHRASILNSNYNVVGIAVLRSGNHVYVTEDFAHRLTAYSEPEADAVLPRAVENYATTHGMPAPKRKPQSQLRHMACNMALNDSLQGRK